MSFRREPDRMLDQSERRSFVPLMANDRGEELLGSDMTLIAGRQRSFFGRLPKWPKGADCKSAGIAFGGSNPSPPTGRKLSADSDQRISSSLNGAR